MMNSNIKNILYIGPYRHLSGWGYAAQHYIRALNTTQHNITLQHTYYNGTPLTASPDNSIVKLEQQYFDHYDIVIQNVLPHMFDYSSRFSKNIGLCYLETDNIEYSLWPYDMQCMDEIWVPSQREKDTIAKTKYDIQVKTLPIPTDIDKFNKTYKSILSPFLQDTFNFYFIGEYTTRKHIEALIIAFHTEFSIDEPVNLVIKSNKAGYQPNMLQSHIEKNIDTLKQTLRLRKEYKKEIIITDELSNDDLCAIHQDCDCFVMPSYGESWCIPCFDAVGFGNIPIVTQNTGMTSYVSQDNGFLVNASTCPILTTEPPLPNIYNAYESWQEVDISSLKKSMRSAYERQDNPHSPDMTQYSYQSIGKLMDQYFDE